MSGLTYEKNVHVCVCAWPLLPNTNQLFSHPHLEFGMAVGVRVCAERESERETVGTYCIEVCWSKREGVGLFRNETAADHMTSLVRSLLFFFPQSHDCLSYNCPCLRAFQATLITDELDPKISIMIYFIV